MQLNDTPVLPWESIQIMAVGDFQMGSAGFDAERLAKHLKWGVDHGVKFYGTGDYLDFLSPSNRRALRNAGLYDTALDLIEEWNEKHMRELADVMKPTTGMWLGMHEGHHYYEFFDGTTTDTRLCNLLKAPFLGTAAITRIPFRDPKNRKRVDCHIWGHHGEGSGSANPIHRLLSVAPGFPQIDIFVQGHNTQLMARSLDTLEVYGKPGHLKLRNRTQLFVAAGGFMRGYEANSKQGKVGRAQGSYVEKAMMRPSALGGPLITVTPRDRGTFTQLDLKCSV